MNLYVQTWYERKLDMVSAYGSFKPGDRVRCIDDFNAWTTVSGGKSYAIDKWEGGIVIDSGMGYMRCQVLFDTGQLLWILQINVRGVSTP